MNQHEVTEASIIYFCSVLSFQQAVYVCVDITLFSVSNTHVYMCKYNFVFRFQQACMFAFRRDTVPSTQYKRIQGIAHYICNLVDYVIPHELARVTERHPSHFHTGYEWFHYYVDLCMEIFHLDLHFPVPCRKCDVELFSHLFYNSLILCVLFRCFYLFSSLESYRKQQYAEYFCSFFVANLF